MPDAREGLVAEVNRTYWDTEKPVTQIAAELGISRRTIYDMLIPEPTGERCPTCGDELAYPNRSARLAGEGVCPTCGQTHDLTLLRELARIERPDTVPPARVVPTPAEIEAQHRSTNSVIAIAGLIALAITLTMALLMPWGGRRRKFR